jgi:hypothetical protein
MSRIHQLDITRRAANAPEMAIGTGDDQPRAEQDRDRKQAGTGPGTMTSPVAMKGSPVMTLARRTRVAVPVVSASDTPWMMNSTPMNAAMLRIVQLMPKVGTPSTIN